MYFLRNDGASRQPIFRREIKIFFFFRLMSGSVAIDSLDIYWWDCIMTPKYVFLRMVPFKEKIRKQIIRSADVMKRVWRTEDEMQWEEWPRPGFNQLMVIKWCCNMAGPLPNVTNTFRMIFMDLYKHLDHNKKVSKHCGSRERVLWPVLCAITLNHDSSHLYPFFLFS